jgi:glycosyltransferase involved in cell wall biosynthesis
VRALFYLLDGATNASSRHRALHYFPYLRQHGIQPLASLPVPEAVYQRLIERGHGRGGMQTKAAFYTLFLACRVRDVLRARQADVVVIQRDLFPFGPPLLERLLANINARLVYDTDDATYLRPSFTPDTPFQRLRRFDKVAEVVTMARWVSAASEPIAAWARRYNPNVGVVPMAIDPAEYDRVHRPAGDRDRMVLGWTGTAGSLRYLEALAPVLCEVARKHPIVVRVVSGAYQRVCLPGVPVEARPWRPDTALQEMKSFDVGLLPLDDAPFEQAKFPFKLLQYFALGVPTVSARVGVARDVIQHGANGFLAGSDREWHDALEVLMSDPDLRDRMARQGRATVLANYTVERVAPLVLEGLARALS